MSLPIDRRTFLGTAAAVTVSASDLLAAEAASRKNSICVFTKPFNSLSFDELADQIAVLGFDGLEAPIRDGGHIEPANVPDKLPAFVEALRKRDLDVTVMTSSINDPADPLTEKVLATASKLGIRRYRMKYFKYDKKKPIPKQLAEWKAQLKDLAAMNAEFGIRAVYQNHAGNDYFGSALWDVAEVLSDISPKQVAVAYDIRHATVEGGMSWPTTFRRVLPHIDTVYVKDFVWDGTRPKNVPLGQGRISPAFFDMLASAGFDGPISLHEEYLDHRKPELVPQHLAAIKKDFATLKGWLKKSGLRQHD